MRSATLGLLFGFLTTVTATAACFDAKGNVLDASHSEYMPCSASGLTTICCGLNRSNPAGGDDSGGFTKDECLPNGLCQNRVVKNGTMDISWWLDFCTDRDIASGNCLNICGAYRNSFGNTPLTPCSAGRNDSDIWCCGGGTDCCTSGVGAVTLPQIFRAGAVLSSSSVSATASSLASTSSAFSSSSSPSSSSSASSSSSQTNSKSGMSGGAIAGIVIGIVVLLVLLAAAIVFGLRASRYKKQAAANQAPAYVEAPGDVKPGQHVAAEKYGHHPPGYAHHAGLVELAQPPSELPGGDIGPLPKK